MIPHARGRLHRIGRPRLARDTLLRTFGNRPEEENMRVPMVWIRMGTTLVASRIPRAP
jgi:hypothetical protein